MFSELTDAELQRLWMELWGAREQIYAITWHGNKAAYTAMALEMSLLQEEINGERASRTWKDR